MAHHTWPEGPIPTPDPAPPGGRKGAAQAKVDGLIAKAVAEQSWKNKAGAIAWATAQGVGTEALEHFGHLTGIGTAISSAKHAAAAFSTMEHLDGLEQIYTFDIFHCTCEKCSDVLFYVKAKKESKVGRRGVKAIPVPFLSTLFRAGEAMKGAYKRVKGTREKNRRKYACILWISAKEGCRVAKAIMEELLGGPEDLLTAVSSYSGILKVAEKMKST